MDPDPEQIRIEIGVGQIDEHAPSAPQCEEPIEASALVADGIEQAEPDERGLAGRLECDASADGPRVRDPLEHGDGVTRPGEQQPGRGTRGARTDDPDPHARDHWLTR